MTEILSVWNMIKLTELMSVVDRGNDFYVPIFCRMSLSWFRLTESLLRKSQCQLPLKLGYRYEWMYSWSRYFVPSHGNKLRTPPDKMRAYMTFLQYKKTNQRLPHFMSKCLHWAPRHVHSADYIFLFLTLRELSPHLSGRPDQSTGLIGGSLMWSEILAQEICIGVNFWNSGEDFVDCWL